MILPENHKLTGWGPNQGGAARARTTHAGAKLYAVRDPGGRLEEIETYQRTYVEELMRTGREDAAARAAARAVAKKAAGKKPVAPRQES